MDDERVSEGHLLSMGSVITHHIHRHELAVVSEGLEVIERNEDVVVVNKPPSMPIHPCGRYRHNSLLHILVKDFGLELLYRAFEVFIHDSTLSVITKTCSARRGCCRVVSWTKQRYIVWIS